MLHEHTGVDTGLPLTLWSSDHIQIYFLEVGLRIRVDLFLQLKQMHASMRSAVPTHLIVPAAYQVIVVQVLRLI